jgi:raffinose/stachyose/melibiose transport system substrate-binding protein
MAMGGRDSWAIALLQNALAVRTAGADYCNEAIIGENTLDTPDIARSVSLLQELVEAGAFDPGVLGFSYEEASMEFNLGHIPMYFNGSWLAGEVESPDNMVQGKIKPIPLPIVSGGKGDRNQFLGGATACYMINSKTRYPDEAVAFAIALAEYQAREAYKAGDDVTCWKSNVDESEVNKVLLEINKLTANATGYVLAWDTFLVGTAIDAHYDLVQQALGRAVTPAEFALKMEAANRASLLEQASN